MIFARIRTTLAAAAALALLPLAAACGAEPGTTEKDGSKRPTPTAEAPAPGGPAEEEPLKEKQPAKDLEVGESFRYSDGIEITVTKIGELAAADFGEHDVKPESGRTAFRISWDVANGSKRTVDLDTWGWAAMGVPTGGETQPITAENGAKRMTGRIAPGRTGSFTAEYSLPRSDGGEVAFAISRIDGAIDVFAEAPAWFGTIK